ncbi:MAG: response regulator [Bdellovibrionales bacterium]|nr:response regulator [Bdellovibrionales bacterium]
MSLLRYPENLVGIKDRFFNKYLWAFYVLMVLLVGCLLAFSIFSARAQLKESAFSQTRSLTLALDEINRRQFDAMAVPLEYISTRIQERGGLDNVSDADLNRFFIRAQGFLAEGFIRSIYAVDKEGHVRLTTLVPYGQKLTVSYKDSPDFNYLRTQKNYTVFSSASASEIDKRKVISLNRTLRGADGRFQGLIGITRSVEDFETFYQNLHLPRGVSFTVFRDDGKVIYRFPDLSGAEGKSFAFSQSINMGGEGVIEGTSRIDGFEKVGYYKFSKAYGLMTYVGYNTDAIFSGWRLVSFSVLAIFLIFMSALMFLTNLVRKRQDSLRQTLEEHAAKEDLIRRIQEKTEVLTGHDFLRELGLQISKAFEVRNVAIGVLMPEHSNAVKFVVNWVDGTFGTDYIYDLKNTPFDNLKPGEFFVYPKSVSKIFTQDPMLSYRNVESCMGLVLQDSEQRAIGIMMIYSDKEMVDLPLKRTVLSVFAARAGAELERVHTDEIRKEVERLRKQIEERSLQSEKMEAIGTLAEGIAHDFNNILAIILATTEKMLSLHKDPKDQHYLEAIKRAGHRARHLVAQILIFSRKDESSVQLIQIKKIFSEVMDFLRATLPAQIRITLDLADCGDLNINADLNQIQQALLNLCVNAARAIGTEGGEIRITLRQAQIKDRPYVKWSLHYNGEEMDRDEIEKIFDPFYAQNIGMVVVQRIVSNHQGFIDVKSASGQGTDFEIFLPVVVNTEAVEEAKMTPYNFKSAQKVMIVDDEPEIGSLIKELLEIEGLQVDAFVDPITALKAFTELQSQYFMIISDLSMPGMSGVEFARKVREMNKKLPMVLWSGYHQFLDEELQDLNVKMLSKPVDVQKLLTLINAELSQLSAPDISKEAPAPDSEPVRPT